MARKQRLAFFIWLALAFSASFVSGQVVPSATGHEGALTAGGFGSMFQPDYAGNGIAQASPNPLFGVGVYVDYKANRWVVVEGEGQWLRFNQYLGINQNTYSIGPKVPIVDFKGMKPYGKVLFGIGSGSFLNGRTPVFTYGGGLDYRLSKHFTLRAFDFEYQQWLVTPRLYPYGGSVGLAYRIF